MKKKLEELSLTDKMIVCHDLTQMDQALILINWCPVQYKHLSNLINDCTKFKASSIDDTELNKLDINFSLEYEKGL